MVYVLLVHLFVYFAALNSVLLLFFLVSGVGMRLVGLLTFLLSTGKVKYGHARLNDGPDIKLFILVGLGRSFFVCCLAHRGSTVGFLLLQCSSGVVRHPRDLQVSVATRFCRVLIFASS